MDEIVTPAETPETAIEDVAVDAVVEESSVPLPPGLSDEAPPVFAPTQQMSAPAPTLEPPPVFSPTPQASAPTLAAPPTLSATRSDSPPPRVAQPVEEDEYTEARWYESGPWGPLAALLALLALLISLGILPLAKVPNHSVGASQVKAHSLTGSDFSSNSLPKALPGPQGTKGATGAAGPPGPPGPAGTFTKVSYVTATGKTSATATCPGTQKAIAGGATVGGTGGALVSSNVVGTNAWQGTATSLSGSATTKGGAAPTSTFTITVTAVCAKVTS